MTHSTSFSLSLRPGFIINSKQSGSAFLLPKIFPPTKSELCRCPTNSYPLSIFYTWQSASTVSWDTSYMVLLKLHPVFLPWCCTLSTRVDCKLLSGSGHALSPLVFMVTLPPPVDLAQCRTSRRSINICVWMSTRGLSNVMCSQSHWHEGDPARGSLGGLHMVHSWLAASTEPRPSTCESKHLYALKKGPPWSLHEGWLLCT